MKPEEKHVKHYLDHLNLGPIDHEPIPNETPDFVVDGRIAIEVRRLNENHFPANPNAKPKGLEEVAITLQNRMRQLLASFGPPTNGNSYRRISFLSEGRLEGNRARYSCPARSISSESTSNEYNR